MLKPFVAIAAASLFLATSSAPTKAAAPSNTPQASGQTSWELTQRDSVVTATGYAPHGKGFLVVACDVEAQGMAIVARLDRPADAARARHGKPRRQNGRPVASDVMAATPAPAADTESPEVAVISLDGEPVVELEPTKDGTPGMVGSTGDDAEDIAMMVAESERVSIEMGPANVAVTIDRAARGQIARVIEACRAQAI